MPTRSLPRGTTLRAYAAGAHWTRFRSAVSLHSHTSYSREVLSDLPRYILKIPFVGGRFHRAGAGVDFSRGWWHPPIDPAGVFESEAGQIARRFGVAPIVSVTDHDDIRANLDLQRLHPANQAPVSFEWTIPYGKGFFHFGVHNLPPVSAGDWFARLAAFTAGPRPDDLHDLMDSLHRTQDVLLVFNHPMWDLACVGDRAHRREMHRFLREHGRFVHALEINGYRSHRENGMVRTLASDYRLPLISGGDRHALAPNAVLNLSGAETFAGFADEVRSGLSHVVVMPEYRQSTELRKLASAADVVRHYRGYPEGHRTWADRVTWASDEGERKLSHFWPRGGPLMVRSAVAALQVLASPAVRPFLLPVVGKGRPDIRITPVPLVP